MSWLLVRVRFPLGSYDAVGEKGRHQWPPAPERVAAAALAGGAGSAAHVLYRLDPPWVSAPRVGRARNAQYSRWVPRHSADLSPAKKYGQKVDKAPGDNAGVLVDPAAQVVYGWQVEQDHVDLTKLAEAFAAVPYLGRPTSAAIIDVELSDQFDAPSGQDVYVPDLRGEHRLSVPTEHVFAQREYIWSLRQGAGAADVRTPEVVRSFARYAVREHTAQVHTADRAQVARRTSGWSWFMLPRGISAQVLPAVAAAVRGAGGTQALPACTDGRLLVIGARGLEDLERIQALAGSGVITAVAQRARPPALVEAISPLVSTARIWTTVAPVDGSDVQRLQQQVLAVTDQAQVADAVRHQEPKAASGLWPAPAPGLTHVSIWFDEPVEGPLFLGETALQAVPAGIEDDEEEAR